MFIFEDSTSSLRGVLDVDGHRGYFWSSTIALGFGTLRGIDHCHGLVTSLWDGRTNMIVVWVTSLTGIACVPLSISPHFPRYHDISSRNAPIFPLAF